MAEKSLLFGLYDQKPLGTRKEDLEYTLHVCYKPLLTFLFENPTIRISLYLSGVVYEWLESAHPEVNMLLSDIVKRKQIELLSGGYYDPILSILPQRDRTLQIEKLTTYIRKRFGVRPRSAWISEQVWDPALVNTLSMSGIRSIIQHTDLLLSGQDPFLMQELDKTIALYPVHEGLTELIEQNEIVSFQQSISAACKTSSHHQLSVMADMSKLINHTMLKEENATLHVCRGLKQIESDHSLVMKLPSEAVNDIKRRDFLPYGWFKKDKPSHTQFYQEVFLNYPEVQLIYGKLLYSAKLIPGIKKEKTLKKQAIKELMKGESFGSFSISQNGGMYQNYLRKENYRHLIEVDKIARERGIFATSITAWDFDGDNHDEYIYRGKNITVVFDRKGGQVIELDYLVNSWNYLDTFVGRVDDLTNRNMAIYREGIKQQAFTDILMPLDTDTLHYDKYSNTQIETLELQNYNLDELDKEKKELQVSFGFSHHQDSGETVLDIAKRYSCGSNSLSVDITLTNNSKQDINRLFANEFNLSFASELPEDVSFHAVDGNHERAIHENRNRLEHVKQLKIRDWEHKAVLTITANKRYTVSKRDYITTMETAMGEEDMYQFTRLLTAWELDLSPGESWEIHIVFRIEKMK